MEGGMRMPESERSRILQAIIAETEPNPRILGREQGSAAFGRADDLSDLDLMLLVEDGSVDEGHVAVERALQGIAPIEQRYVLPQPTWHGHWQAFYRLQGTSPYLIIDLCVLQASTTNRFLEPELHGKALVCFDKTGWVRQQPSDPAPVAEQIRARLAADAAFLDLFAPFVRKEVLRGREVDALSFYNGLVVPRLVHCLRSRYAPWRHTFGLRYLGHDLPPEVYAEVRDLLFVGSAAELPDRTDRAVAMFRRTMAELESLDLVLLLEQTRQAADDRLHRRQPQ